MSTSDGVITIDGPLISIVLPLAAFVLLTLGTALFVAAEFSLVTVDRADVETRARAGDRRARGVRHALRTLSFQLSGAQLGITITTLLTGYMAEPALARLIRPLVSSGLGEQVATGVAIASALVVATVLSMLFGELVPKNAAIARPLPTAYLVTPAHRGFSRSFRWLIAGFNGAANWIVRRLGIQPQQELASARSAQELGLLAALSARAGTLPRETAVLLQRTIRFGEKRAAEAMTPRVDLVALDVNATVQDLITAARRTGHSRFPVYIDTLDQIIGVATVTDGLAIPPARRATTPVRQVARPPVLVPEHLDLDNLLKRLQEANASMAVVVDEYGGTDGVVTIEDLVEELVGEISDEHDAQAPSLAPQAPPSHPATEVTAPGIDPTRLVPGLLRADELAEQVGFRLPEGPYETLAGFLMARLGHIPVEGETVTEDGWEFTVTVVERHRVEQVRVRPPQDWEPPTDYVPQVQGRS